MRWLLPVFAILSCQLFATDNPSDHTPEAAVVHTLNALVHQRASKSSSEPVGKDQIAGCCFPAGTKVVLLNAKGVAAGSIVVIGGGSFQFNRLESGAYTLKPVHPRLKSPNSEIAIQARTGQWLNISSPEAPIFEK